MKGVGVAVSSIIIIVVFAVFFATFLYMVNNNVQTRTQLNFESLELMRLKSTFSLFSKSLGTTWFISTVQAVFITADESIGCGRDDSRLEAGYWYQLRPGAGRDGQTDSRGNPRTPAADKYNSLGFNPQICYPRDEHIVAYIRNVLDNKGFLNLRELRPEDAGGVTITLPRKSGTNNIDTTISTNLLDNRIESAFRQRITAAYEAGTIDMRTENNFPIETSLRQMAAAGRRVVDALLEVGDGMKGGPATPPGMPHYAAQFPGVTATASQSSYMQEFTDLLSNKIIGFNSMALLPADVSVSTNIEKLTLGANSNSVVIGSRPPGSGLVLHYDAVVTYSEPQRYYYHNENSNKFEKAPIRLRYKVEDYLPALDCVLWQLPDFDGNVALFNWEKNGDMLCCAGLLFSCGSTIPDLPPGHLIAPGSSITDTAGPAQKQCNDILGGASIECTATGFTIG